MRGQGRRECPGPGPVGFVQVEDSGTSVSPSSLVDSCDKRGLGREAGNENPISSNKVYAQRTTINLKPLKRGIDIIFINFLMTSCRSYKTWTVMITSSSYMAFTLQGPLLRALCMNAFM